MNRPKTSAATVRFPIRVKQKLAKEAREQKRSFASHVIWVLENYANKINEGGEDRQPGAPENGASIYDDSNAAGAVN